MKDKIYITQPFLPPLDEYTELLNQIWDTKQLTNNGPFCLQFEEALANYLNVEYISIVNNATIGLIIAQRAIGFTGDIITTPFSFSATAHSIKWNGLNPIFVDTDKYAGNLDPRKVQESITKNTGGILAVHNYGMPGNVEKLNEIADQYNIPLIYDAAPAIGVDYKGNSIFNFGDLSVMSFHGTKIFTTFEGGAIVSTSEKMKQKIDHIKNFAIINQDQVNGLGINGKMNEAEAALGIIQLKYLDSIIEKRKTIYNYYHQNIKNINGIDMIEIPSNTSYNYSYAPVNFSNGIVNRDRMYIKMKENNIFCRKYWHPLITENNIYKNSATEDLTNAKKLSESILCLPIYPSLNQTDIDRVINILES